MEIFRAPNGVTIAVDEFSDLEYEDQQQWANDNNCCWSDMSNYAEGRPGCYIRLPEIIKDEE